MSSTETATPIETSLCLSVEQIVEGDRKCDYCDQDAWLMIATGAGPEPAPHCSTHGSHMVRAFERLVRTVGVAKP